MLALLCACVSRAVTQTPEPHVTVERVTVGAAHVAELPATAFHNANGSARLRDDQYRVVRRRIVPLLERWALDSRLALNPAYVTALLLKESGETRSP